MNRNGFTILEVMVVIGIFMVLISGIYSVLVCGQNSWAICGTQMDISSSARKAMYKMAEELSQAGLTTVNISAALDSIVFQIPDTFSAGSINWSNQIRYALGGVNGQQLLRTDLGSGNVEAWANHITQLQFNQTTADTVEIQLTLSKQSMRGDILSMQVSTQVKVRNE